MRVKSLIQFASVPKGTEGECIRDDDLWKVTWDGIVVNGTLESGKFGKKLLSDWFDDWEKKKWLVEI